MKLVKGIKEAVHKMVRSAGYELVRTSRPGQDQMGRDPFLDMRFYLNAEPRPLIFDVGGNVGQTVDKFKELFPRSTIHSFEPSPSTFARLQAHCQGRDGVHTWNYGVGSSQGTLPFTENTKPDMSSFLPPSEFCWGSVAQVTQVPVETLDAFALEKNIDFIHVLKSDTQGYDFEVFKGAERLMNENKIGLVYFEFIFSDMYKNLPPFHEVFQFLTSRNFALVSFYESHFQRDLVSWTDVMFVNKEFYQKSRPIAA